MPKPAKSVGQNTRQMLDELDALMERMLALPVEDDEPTAVETKKPMSASLALLEERHEAQEQFVQTRVAVMAEPNYFDLPESPFQDDLLATLEQKTASLGDRTLDWLKRREAEARDLVEAEKPIEPEKSIAAEKPVAAPLPDPIVEALQEPVPMEAPDLPSRSSEGWLLLALRGINQLFDGVTYLIGPLGGFLRGGLGRGVIGVSGIGMLMGAIGWFAVKRLGLP